MSATSMGELGRIQLARRRTLHRTTRTRLTIASTTIKGEWAQAAAQETMCNLASPTPTTTQMRIMKPIHTPSAKRRNQPQINNNTAINGVHRRPSNSRIVIQCLPFNRHTPLISNRTKRGGPSTKPAPTKPIDGMSCLIKIICENSMRDFLGLKAFLGPPGNFRLFFCCAKADDTKCHRFNFRSISTQLELYKPDFFRNYRNVKARLG